MQYPDFRDHLLDERGVKKSTADTYMRNLRYLEDWNGDRDLLELTPDDFQEFREYRGWGKNASRLCLTAIKLLQEWKLGLPYPLERFQIPRNDKPRTRPMTPKKLRVLQMACPDTPAGRQYSVMMPVLFDTLARVSEIVTAKLEDLDLDEGLLMIYAIKTDEWRPGILSELTLALLASWIREERPKFARSDTETIFCNTRTGEPYTVDGMRANFARIAEAAGIDFSPHDFRHGGAKRMSENGVQDRMIMLAGGWKDFSTFQRYTAGAKLKSIRDRLPTSGIGDLPAATGRSEEGPHA